jgi:plasmid stability protein
VLPKPLPGSSGKGLPGPGANAGRVALNLTGSARPACHPGRVCDPSSTAECRTVAIRRPERHNGAMPSVQIKDVPESTHAVLRQRAAAAHQSLQEYLRSRLIAEASQPTLEEVLDRAGGRSGGSVPLADAVKTVQGDRARR